MTRRLRLLLERPLDSATARLVVVLGGAICVGFAVLLGLGLLDPGAPGSPRSAATGLRADMAPAPVRPTGPKASPEADETHRPQDPQDRLRTPAHRRATRELATHRAMQSLPYRHGDLSIELVGARGSKAILAVAAPTVAAARRGYRLFLRRRRDDGRSYLPRFIAEGGRS